MRLNLNRLAELVSSYNVPTSAALCGRQLLLARVGWLIVLVLTVGLLSASIPAHYEWLINFASPDLDPAIVRANLEAAGISIEFYAIYLLLISLASTMVWVAVGVIIFWRRSDDWIALFTSLCLLIFGTFTINNGPTALAVQYPAIWLPVHMLAFFGSVSLNLFFYIFPDGKFVPRWTRWTAILWTAHEVAFYLFPNSMFNIDRSFPLLEVAVFPAFACVAIGSQVYRYRHVSGPVQRQQTKWVVFGTVAAGLGMMGCELLLDNSPTITQFGSPYAFALVAGSFGSVLLIPLSIGVAILRHRLWGLDVIINRTLVYGALSVSIVAVYVLVVGSFGVLFETHGSLPISVLATGLVAVLFVPLRDRLQRGVNRLMYGERHDPYSVLSRLGWRLEATLAPEAALSTIVETVAQALKLPYAAIALKRDDGGYATAAAYGSLISEPVILPLAYQRMPVGQLILGPRAPGEVFSPSDRRLLEDLARQTGVAVHAVRLTADLQRSRERLVTAREEERRRMRRDLHDGLGPQLASLTMMSEAAHDLVPLDPVRAREILKGVTEQAREAITDVRRLVYALRPPALDTLGLMEALRSQVPQDDGLRITFEGPEDLPTLPAAVEVAVYRIALEALTNVVRHAEASNCSLRVTLDEETGMVKLEIEDDGRGIGEGRSAGVGLTSMRERAEELGGTCSIESIPSGGTRVCALLPYVLSETMESKADEPNLQEA